MRYGRIPGIDQEVSRIFLGTASAPFSEGGDGSRLLEAALAPGETLALSASVVPAYADDLTVAWSSTDPAVAEVDAQGRVTAVAPGACDIICTDSMGHTDACALTVAD